MALVLGGCETSKGSSSYQQGIAKLPSHIEKCPSKVEIAGYIAMFEAQVPPEQREAKVRELIVALRNSELKNTRCLAQAIAYYNKVRSQREAK